MTYTTLPSYGKWQSDSSVLFAVRKDDIVLHRIDELLEHYWSTKDISKKFIFLSDLYFTADYWLKIYQTGPKAMEKKRQPAIYALFARLAAELCTAFGCTINGLTRELELMWGRELSAPAVHVDLVARKAEFLTRAEAAKFRLRIGTAWSFSSSTPMSPFLGCRAILIASI